LASPSLANLSVEEELMNSKERILAAWNGQSVDYVPLTTWCFGFRAPDHLRWERNGSPVDFWYSKRMEHLHTMPHPWTLEDDFQRVLAWRSVGVDDILDVSVPWSISPQVSHSDAYLEVGEPGGDPTYPVRVREYETPDGHLRHAVRQTGEDPGEGWVIQPDHVPLIEDYNIPRAVEHIVNTPEHVARVRHLYQGPDAEARSWFEDRMRRVGQFAQENHVPVQAWSAFGMDGVVWMTGVEGAILMAMDTPEAFGELVNIVAEADLARTELAADNPAVDMVVQRGWYSSTDFWSPTLFDQFVFPNLTRMTAAAHRHGKKFGYVMTTGVKILGPRLADAGVDVLYFADPIQDKLSLETAAKLLGDRMTLVGGANALSLNIPEPGRIESEIKNALEVLGPTQRFILHPVDAIFPDTPWSGVKRMIQAWNQYR
jgi:hypothetical protein